MHYISSTTSQQLLDMVFFVGMNNNLNKEEQPISVVYIAGTSFSGSTILGYVLGSDTRFINAGELKFFHRVLEMNKICSCGVPVEECTFWKPFHNDTYNIYEIPNKRTIAKEVLQILLGHLSFDKKTNETDEYRLLENILTAAKKTQPDASVIIDVSKSISRLIELVRTPGIDVKVIYMQRDAYGVLSSFKKHKQGVLRGFVNYIINHVSFRKLVKSLPVETLTVSYKSLAQDTDVELRRIGNFIGADYSNYINNISTIDFHVMRGNRFVQQKILSGFEGIRYDESWKKRLNIVEKSLAHIANYAKKSS